MNQTNAEMPEDERRRSRRRRTLKEGRVVFNDHSVVIDCTIRDLSDEGARLLLETTQDIPDEFFLYIVQHRQRAKVEVRWRTGDAMGVEFVSALEEFPGLLKF
ncbi:PilZ domain-containing protein [Pseudovibrio exalbescens]|uniref:PilZ domain-containing protein n=1 Tax=Pseudovibrio exalbescens TaxID=197461 RepID=UPI002364FF2A|nr:PilZ domain-containing protein [Pseudovibrio exalbescens]MDD7908929.1 PilZ domain-containing protein [Pseudovibrio exalbescens]